MIRDFFLLKCYFSYRSINSTFFCERIDDDIVIEKRNLNASKLVVVGR